MGTTEHIDEDPFGIDDEPRLEDHVQAAHEAAVEIIDLDGPGTGEIEIATPPGSVEIDLPDDPALAKELLLSELLLIRQESGEYLESLQRVAAEYDNFRRRTERDQADLMLRATQRLVESLLPTLDAFDAALAYEPQGPGEEKLLAGMQGTYSQFMETLARQGLEVIEAHDAAFDPSVHEAVAGGGDGELVVSQVLRTGYRLGDRVVRPALVMVAAGEPHRSDDVEDGQGDED